MWWTPHCGHDTDYHFAPGRVEWRTDKKILSDRANQSARRALNTQYGLLHSDLIEATGVRSSVPAATGQKMSVWQRIGDTVSNISNALDPDNWLPGGRDAAFTLALVALAAKMAVADGVVSASEERVFRRLVHAPTADIADIERFFELAQQDVAGYQSYARKVRKLFADKPETLEHVIDALFHIASADGMIHEGELEYLHNVSAIFGFDEARFDQIAAQFIIDNNGPDPYLVLGLSPDADDAEVKRVYRSLIAEHHPDRLMAKGVPTELISIATARVAAINAAHDQIISARAG